MNHENCKNTKNLCCKEFLKKRNVVSVGVGYKVRNGVKTKEKCIVVGVRKKELPHLLQKSDIVPSEVNGINTDVIELGHIKALADEDIDPTQKMRDPMRPGISIGHKDITAGTFGLVVKKDGVPYILSNNHVLSNSNNANIGDDIIQPGPYDGGTEKVAELTDFVPIHFEGEEIPPDEDPDPPPDDPPVEPPKDGGCFFRNLFVNTVNKVLTLTKRKSRIVAVVPQDIVNIVDCAIAKPLVNVNNDVIMIAVPTGINTVNVGDYVKKYGRTTKFTEGSILQTDATVQVDYDQGKTAIFEDQLIAGPMSQGGDSGSVVLNENNEVIGLLYAGSSSVTIFNKIQNVFTQLGVSL